MGRFAAVISLMACSALAQAAPAILEEARQRMGASQWQEALDRLVQVKAASPSRGDSEAAADLLTKTGMALRAARLLDDAVRAHEEALATRRALHGESDDAGVAQSLYELASVRSQMGRSDVAMPLCEAALAMQIRLFDAEDNEAVAQSIGGVASCLRNLGRREEAVARYEEALAMEQRLHHDGDHQSVASRLETLGRCLGELGRHADALVRHEEALAMQRRMHGDSDHAAVANGLLFVARDLLALGRSAEALPSYEAAAAMRRRLHADRPHADVPAVLNELGFARRSLGRETDALAAFEEALATQRLLSGAADDAEVSTELNNVASSLQRLGRPAAALLLLEEALAMDRRLHADDHDDVAVDLTNLGSCLESLGRAREALPHYEAALAIWKRLHGAADDLQVAMGMHNVAFCLQALGRLEEALPMFEAALATRRRVHGDRDHREVATGCNNVAFCLEGLGRAREALPLYEASLAMHQRLCGGRDDALVANGLSNLGGCLESLARYDEALPRHEAALAMRQRLYAGRDHSEIGVSMAFVARRLQALGRPDAALPLFEARVAMERRLHDGGDHPLLAGALGNLAHCLEASGRHADALPVFEATLAMFERVHGPVDHPETIRALQDLGSCLLSLGRIAEAMPKCEAALAAWRRRFGERDHPDVARGLRLVAWSRELAGDPAAALPLYESALAMHRRLYGDRDSVDIVWGLDNVARCLDAVGKSDAALAAWRSACAAIDRLREASRFSDDMRQSFFDSMKGGGAFEQLQRLAVGNGDAAAAMETADRARGRQVLDLVGRQGIDMLADTEARARRRGDEAMARRARSLRAEIDAVEVEGDRVLHLLTKLADDVDPTAAATRRSTLAAEAGEVDARRRRLLDERARLVGDTALGGRVRSSVEVKAILGDGELLLVFSIAPGAAFLYVAARDGDVDAIPISGGAATTASCMRVADALTRSQSGTRGRDPGGASSEPSSFVAISRELFPRLVPGAVWSRVRAARRVFVAAHRELHRLPFEALVTDVVDGKPVYWLDSGPPISYVPSGSVLYWLRGRSADVRDDATGLDLLAVGDPGALKTEPEVPLVGVFVVTVNDSGEGARVGLRPGDVITCYDGKPLADDKALRDAIPPIAAAIEDGRRDRAPIPLGVWRRGHEIALQVGPGPLGVQVGPGSARVAFAASLSGDAKMERVSRAGDVERVGRLPPLKDARAEVEAIAGVFAGRQAKTKLLLGAEATEPAVFDLAAKAKYLHFACHGIAEEYAGQSLSMLVLSQPEHVLPGDNGLLKLTDLFHSWGGRLSSCRLVVLSACRTNVGPTLRDEAPQALPIGFLFAGVPAVISSLWAVDDASTRELMTDFYGRLLAGETDRLKAFTDAKKVLRAKYPDPFHWAPFLFMGSPE